MIVNLDYNGKPMAADLNRPLDISIPLSPEGPRAWYVDKMRIEPVCNELFTGSVARGGAVNFNSIAFNPHGHGTHTESVGHITSGLVSVNKQISQFFFIAEVITVTPQWVDENTEEVWRKKGDSIIRADQLQQALDGRSPRAVVIRTLPNSKDKQYRNYSSSNFTYFEPEGLKWLSDIGVQHLLVDLPSVDREEDGGLLLAHRAFWNYDAHTRLHCTITEFVFVDDSIIDGAYLLNLQVAPFENDAAPSRPVLFKLEPR